MKTNNILLSPDVDPLAVPAGGVDTSMPILVEKLYAMTIAEAKTHTNTESGKSSVRLVLKTMQDGQSTDGEVVNAGYPCYHYFAYTPSEKYTAVDIAKNGAVILKAAGLKNTTVRQLIDNPAILEGKEVTVKLGVRKAEGTFPASNVVKQWVEVK